MPGIALHFKTEIVFFFQPNTGKSLNMSPPDSLFEYIMYKIFFSCSKTPLCETEKVILQTWFSLFFLNKVLYPSTEDQYKDH